MKTTPIIYIVCVASVLLVACGDNVDCRQQSQECASGFTCEEGKSDKWECVKSEEVKPEVVPDELTPPEPKHHFARGPKVETTACKDHPRCSKMSLECLCNAKKQLVSQTLDKDGDGKGDEKAVYLYNQEDFLTFVIVDEGMDGADDLRHEYGYRGEGIPMFWEITRAPDSTNKKPNSRLTYVYDNEGKLIFEDFDTGIDNTIDRRCVYDPPCPPPIPNPTCKPICKEVKIAPPQDGEHENPDDR